MAQEVKISGIASGVSDESTRILFPVLNSRISSLALSSSDEHQREQFRQLLVRFGGVAMSSTQAPISPLFGAPSELAVFLAGSTIGVTLISQTGRTTSNNVSAEFLWSPTGLFANAVSIGTTPATTLSGSAIQTVLNEAAMLALSGVAVGDVVVRQDLNEHFYAIALPSNLASNWRSLSGDAISTIQWNSTGFASTHIGRFFARANDGQGWSPYVSVGIILNSPPGAFSILTPSEAERFNTGSNVVVTWGNAPDPDQPASAIRYTVERSLNGGTTWAAVTDTPITDPGVTTYTYQSSSYPIGGPVRVRITPFDGYHFGPSSTVGFGFRPVVTNIAAALDSVITAGSTV